ncbi:MAG TPA: transporter substrate-binding domain-containing protein [Candidatus Avilachnospira avistercoris]|nr:transporter substrate-binding domain-containing protein [Candidatus Avilachnospira avistercoris]
MKKSGLMKYGAAFLAAAMLMGALTACGGSSEADTADTTAAETSAEASAETTKAASSETEESSAEAEPSRLDEILEAGVITMATSPDYAPYEFEDISSGETVYAGADIELGKYIAEKLGVELQIEAMDFNACQGAVSMGSVDMAISGFAYTEERAENFNISDGYNIKDSDQGIIVLKSRAEELSTKEAFTGMTLGVQNASLQQQLRAEQLPDSKEEIITNLNDGIMMLITGKIDALVCSVPVAEQYCVNYPDLAVSDYLFEYESEGIRILVEKGEDELLEAINEVLAEVNESGIYQQWTDEALELATSLGIETN